MGTVNIEDLTVREMLQIAQFINDRATSGTGDEAGDKMQKSSGNTGCATNPMIGCYVIARCYAAGVHAGQVASVDGENVVLLNSRRLWSWKAKDGVALSGLAQHGLKDDGCKVDSVNPVIYLTGVCELIPTAPGVKESIDGYK